MGTCSLEFIKQVNENFDYILTPISWGEEFVLQLY